MTKEKILATVKDMIMTLRSPNIHAACIESSMIGRCSLIKSEYEKLDLVDREWVDKGVDDWLHNELIPRLSKGHKKTLKMNGYFS